MPDPLKIPELDALARELNAGSGRAEVPDLGGEAGTLATERLAGLLELVVERGGSDLLLIPGLPPVLRVAGLLAATSGEPIDEETIRVALAPHLGARHRAALEERGAADFSVRLGAGWRFRANVHRQKGTLAAAFRALPRRIPTLAELNLPESLTEVVRTARGLVLVCGPTGSGKSSTLAALVGEINRTRTAHVLTIEDPIEYEHTSHRSIIEQIEVGTDTPTFAGALSSALRQDPDVILVGEMRDLETVQTALTAAETGHLILSTLHTNDVVQAIHRIVDVFPPVQQAQIRQQLSLALHAVVCQQLVPLADGSGRRPAVEVLLATYPVRSHIRKERLQNLWNEITLGRKLGMVAMEESLAALVKSGAIALDEARMRTTRPDELESLLSR